MTDENLQIPEKDDSPVSVADRHRVYQGLLRLHERTDSFTYDHLVKYLSREHTLSQADAQTYLNGIRSIISEENQLINNRMTWFHVITGLLITAYGLVVKDYLLGASSWLLVGSGIAFSLFISTLGYLVARSTRRAILLSEQALDEAWICSEVVRRELDDAVLFAPVLGRKSKKGITFQHGKPVRSEDRLNIIRHDQNTPEYLESFDRLMRRSSRVAPQRLRSWDLIPNIFCWFWVLVCLTTCCVLVLRAFGY